MKLFIYVLFNNAVTASGYTVSDDRLVYESQTERGMGGSGHSLI
jgi:hypothetical protein